MFVWLIIIFINTVTGLLLSRLHGLRIYVDKINIPRGELSVKEVKEPNNERLHSDRKSPQDQGTISILLMSWIEQCKQSIRSHHAALLESDNINYSGFAPPRVTRLLISTVIIIENLVAILQANKDELPLKSISYRAGQLSLLNMLPLLISVAPDVLLVHTLRHSRQQTLWLHELYAWLIWYEVVLHVWLSLFTTSQISMRFPARQTMFDTEMCEIRYLGRHDTDIHRMLCNKNLIWPPVIS